MRITNNMIINKTTSNMNSNRLNVDKLNTQMSTQKKIQKPSEDPVIAIRALRLRTSLSQVTQYYEKNIPDANSWLDTTETALTNMQKLLNDIRTQCVNGTTDTLTADDRNTILTNLKALQEQVYSEGNADYAGRTVFTGYRTNCKLVFDDADEASTISYDITESISASKIETHTYITDGVTVPSTAAEITDTTALEKAYSNSSDYERVRLAYGNVTSDPTITFSDASITAANYTIYDTLQDWEDASATAGTENAFSLGDDDMVFIKETGELVLGKNLASSIKSADATIDVDYNKTGFNVGELRPEFYFNCTDVTDSVNPVSYVNFDNGARIYQDISYTIATGQELVINTQAADVFNSDIYQDVKELTSIVQRAITANENVAKIKEMLNNSVYADYTDELNEWLETATREKDLADEAMQETYSSYITRFDNYLNNVNLELTKIGTKGDRLDMTETRVGNQQSTLEKLKSENEDEDLSEIIINYTAAYVAYQACLQAASKVEKQSLLDYL
ncbi:MAG: flagellar hook-associated protein FlgL [Lachnospiraceae bacterium]|nr:flagellar hook-associated protein FlgL [Lachnospiraceae bacterium]